MFKNKGDRLESLIQYFYQELSKLSNKNIKVKTKYDIDGKSGTTHNIDVYYQFELNGIIHRVIFECKNWKNKVSKDKVLTLKAIIDDIPNSVGVMVAPKGYQSGTQTFAEHHGIKLISGSEQSLLAIVVQSKLSVVLPDETVIGEPFYCLMEKDNNGELTGNYIQNGDESGKFFLILYFSKKEARESRTDLKSVVRGIDKNHLTILCEYSEHLGLKLAIKQFVSTEALGVDANLLKNYFL
ncbi:restriction endonuclease [Lactiplantibacillus sp. WILCCON 0030]|uniref:Restriction endonuclease n=1 Tax=Lactiplantibacillus brownii TaxID=3069269 RepID=A0ABU1A730_9LACO|nr:restriction endonuclease [Lactiplantibacillus brownii]MDQ7936752.1 restriction endonuclease [Lactiplantibacillus brownii]